MVNRWLGGLATRFFPPRCLLCGAPGEAPHDLCAGCRADLPQTGPACPQCALPNTAGVLCGQCLQKPPSYDRIFAPWHYAAPADHLVKVLKFRGQLQPAQLMGALLAERLARLDGPRPGCLIPVPLHAGRLRERGFNQAVELARPIAQRLGLTLDTRSCERSRATAAQSTLPARQRAANLRGAFRVLHPPVARHVALVDDVVTTGHTVNELAKALKRVGVERVEVWAFARAHH
jgi:ComF family protein